MSEAAKDMKQPTNPENIRASQCAYAMQPPTLRKHSPYASKRFNDKEMIMLLNKRYEMFERTPVDDTHIVYWHSSNGSVIKKNPIPFSEVLNEAYSNFSS